MIKMPRISKPKKVNCITNQKNLGIGEPDCWGLGRRRMLRARLLPRIDECIAAVDSLKTATAQARIDGADIGTANKIATACGEWKYADLSVINNRARGAMISSIVGATTGTVGTITSASANTDATRSDANKEKTLNTASNVLAGTAAVASGVATVFNATQIAAVKKIVKIADECEAALQ